MSNFLSGQQSYHSVKQLTDNVILLCVVCDTSSSIGTATLVGFGLLNYR